MSLLYLIFRGGRSDWGPETRPPFSLSTPMPLLESKHEVYIDNFDYTSDLESKENPNIQYDENWDPIPKPKEGESKEDIIENNNNLIVIRSHSIPPFYKISYKTTNNTVYYSPLFYGIFSNLQYVSKSLDDIKPFKSIIENLNESEIIKIYDFDDVLDFIIFKINDIDVLFLFIKSCVKYNKPYILHKLLKHKRAKGFMFPTKKIIDNYASVLKNAVAKKQIEIISILTESDFYNTNHKALPILLNDILSRIAGEGDIDFIKYILLKFPKTFNSCFGGAILGNRKDIVAYLLNTNMITKDEIRELAKFYFNYKDTSEDMKDLLHMYSNQRIPRATG
jgi:hypothetical protein